MMNETVRGRGGEKLPIDEYMPGQYEELDARLTAIAEEPDDGILDRASTWVFDNLADGPGFKTVVIICGVLSAGAIFGQVSRLFS